MTTVEIKSGYGLSEHDEARCLRVARAWAPLTGQTVRTTALAAHALPPEFDGRADDYIDAVCAGCRTGTRRAWSMRWTASAKHRLHARPDRPRLRRGARGWACR